MDPEELKALARMIAEIEGLDPEEFAAQISQAIEAGAVKTPEEVLAYAKNGGQQPAPAPTAAQAPTTKYRFPLPAPYKGKVQPHGGTELGGSDLFADAGTQVRSASSGKVIKAGFSPVGGNYVLVQGDDGKQYYYAHMLITPMVKSGERVEAGQQIGQVGQTGNAEKTQPHLHFGVGDTIQEGVGAKGGVGTNFDAISWLNSLTGSDEDIPFTMVGGKDKSVLPTPYPRIDEPLFPQGKSLSDLLSGAEPFNMTELQAGRYFPFAQSTDIAGSNVLRGLGVNPEIGYGKFLKSYMPQLATAAGAESVLAGQEGGNWSDMANRIMDALKGGRAGAEDPAGLVRRLRDLANRRVSGEDVGSSIGDYLQQMEDPETAIRGAANLLRPTVNPMVRSSLTDALKSRYESYLRRSSGDVNASLFAYLLSR